MPQQKRSDVTLNVTNDVELETGVVLPAGSYNGTSKEIGLQTHDGVSWTVPRYYIELSGDQLAAIGAQGADNPVSTEYDVTEYVRSGVIEVL